MTHNILIRLARFNHRYFRSCCKVTTSFIQKRDIVFLLNWLYRIFNTVDIERLKLVGPDRACAEWLLRNGATVRFKGQPNFINDYNELIALEAAPESSLLRVEEIYAKDASLSSVGFEHLKDCKHVRKITFIFCSHLDNTAMFELHHVKESLQFLELRACFNIGDEGIVSLTQLRNLRKLILANLVSVKSKHKCKSALEKALVNCKVHFDD